MLIVTICAIIGAIVSLAWGIHSLMESVPTPSSQPVQSNSNRGGMVLLGGLIIAFICLTIGVRQIFVVRFSDSELSRTNSFPALKLPLVTTPVANPRALFEESRAGVTKSDVQDTLRDMESRVPGVLRDVEAELPRVTADIEREMLRNAGQYGMSPADVREQMRQIEAMSRQQIRGMNGDVRQQIKDLEQPIWDELRRIERGY